MKQGRRLLFYILLNMVVSAVTMIGVLYLWDNTNLKHVLFSTSPGASSQTVSDAPSTPDTFQTPASLQIEIDEVGGVGNLDTEYVRLRHVSSSSQETISLEDWRLKDEDNHEFAILSQSGFEQLELHQKGAVNIFTKAGQSNPIELYLGFSEPLWEPGETVSLVDPRGEIHDSFLIP